MPSYHIIWWFNEKKITVDSLWKHFFFSWKSKSKHNYCVQWMHSYNEVKWIKSFKIWVEINLHINRKTNHLAISVESINKWNLYETNLQYINWFQLVLDQLTETEYKLNRNWIETEPKLA
jgi:hypothetical protein